MRRQKNQLINVSLNDQFAAIDEVVIKSAKENKNVTSAEMLIVKLGVKEGDSFVEKNFEAVKGSTFTFFLKFKLILNVCSKR